MISKSHSRKIWRTALLPVIDFLSIVAGSSLIYLIRYRWLDDNFFGYNFGIKQIYGLTYLRWSLLFALIIIIIYTFLGLYEVNRKNSFWKTLISLSSGVFVVLLGLITYFFFYEYDSQALPNGVPVSRFILATGGFVVLYMVLFGRAIIWAVEHLLFKLGWGKFDVVVIGDQRDHLSNFLQNRPDIDQIYYFTTLNKSSLNRIKNGVTKGLISEIYLLAGQNELEIELTEICERYKVSFIFSPLGLKDYQAFDLKAVTIGQKVFLELKYTKLDGWYLVLKRMFDICFSAVFLVFFSWLYLIIAIAIKLDSEGSVFYGNKRVGPDGKEFTLWKFRRMKSEYCVTDSNSEALKMEQELISNNDARGEALYKITNDPRSTRIGVFLEKYSLDELPQFYNVLLGNMSLVGPRPHQLREVVKYSSHHFKVLNIKPGITGMAQVNGRSDLSLDEEVNYDTFYVENWNFLMDLQIIFKTPLVIILKRHKS
ncbi:MAG: exopolysaccharide biosynthesis polyprenyl glycosylphosphotransferase [Patescibacteria group bacterium]